MQTFTESLIANTPKRLPGGAFFILLETAAPINIRFFGPNGRALYTATDVESVYGEEFREKDCVSVELTSTVNQTVKIGVSERPVTVQRIGGTVDANMVPGSSITSQSDLTLTNGAAAVVISPQNSNKKYSLVTVLSANSAYIRAGDSAIGAAKGNPIWEGQTVPIEGSMAIYGYMNQGANATVCVSDVFE